MLSMRSHKSTPPMLSLYSLITAGLLTGIWTFSFFFFSPSVADILKVISHELWKPLALICCHTILWLPAQDSFWPETLMLLSPSFCITLSLGSLLCFGTRLFVMVPVAGRPFASNASMRLIVVKYQSKNRWLPVGTDSTKRRTAAGLTPSLWSVNVFLPWYTSKSSIRPFWEARTKTFRLVGFSLPRTYCLTGQWPVKGMICSSMQTFCVFARLRQPCLTRSSNGLTFQRISAFFVSSVIARSSTVLSEFLSLKNLSLVILLLITGTFGTKTF